MLDQAHFFYSAFGLSIGSNQPIPGLLRAEKSLAKPAIEVVWGAPPPDRVEPARAAEELYYESRMRDENDQPAFRIWRLADDEWLRMKYVDGVEFWFDRRGTKVCCTRPESLTIADAAVYLLGPILGVLLRLRGVTCLHASAVTLGGNSVVFAGPEGAGKSTTATALGRRGHPIVSDDIVAIEEHEGQFFVLPAHPYVCLWPESMEMLYGRHKAVPGFAPTWDKARLDLAEHGLKFQEQPIPLGAVCLLGARSTDSAPPCLERAPSREGLLELVANSYGTNLLEKQMRASEFELLGRLVSRVPVWWLHPNGDGTRIETLCELIEERCGSFGAGRSVGGLEDGHPDCSVRYAGNEKA